MALTLCTVGAVALTAVGPSTRADASTHDTTHWVGTWSTADVAPAASGQSATGFTNQTLRQIVHTSVGGSRLRIRLSNVFGGGPLEVSDVHVGIRKSGAALEGGTDRQVTFGGSVPVSVAAGQRAVSDPVALPVSAEQDLVVSIYFNGASGPATWHQEALTTNYYAAGDHVGDMASAAFTNTDTSWFFLDGVDVDNPAVAGSVVTFGPSTTDGNASTLDANLNYPDDLARRLLGLPPGMRMSVLNAGISGNQLLADGGTAGVAAPKRFERDVIDQTGVRAVIIWEGTNDIGNNPALTPDQITGVWQQLIDLAHQHGIRVIGATLQPDKGAGYYTEAGNKVREAANEWMRTSGAFDGVVDFDRVLRDPSDPDSMLPAYDSGDHLHPNNAGYQAIADGINLRLLTGIDARDPFSGTTTASPAVPTVRPGGSTTVSLDVQSWSDRSTTLDWTAAPSGGVGVSPDHGTVTVAPNGETRLPVTVTGGDTDGWWPVHFDFTDGGISAMGAAMTVGVNVPTATATRAPGPVTIDGRLDDVWSDAEPITVTPDDPTVRAWGTVWDVPPEGGTVRVMWDDTHLYVFARMTDADILAPVTDISAGAPWSDDGVAIYLGGDSWSFKLAVTAPTSEGDPLVAGAVGDADNSGGTVTARPDAANAAFVRTATGYDLEYAINLGSLVGGYHPAVGDTLRFTPLVLDRRAESGAMADIWGQAMWVGTGDNPDHWGFLRLEG